MPSKRPEGKVDRLALAMAKGASLAAAARGLDVAESTARRWASSEGFKDQVDAIRRAMISRAVGQLTGAATKAARTLAALLGSADEDVRLKAARAVLADLMAVQSHNDLAARIEALERSNREQHELAGAAGEA